MPGIDIPAIATGYGIASEHVDKVSDLTHAVKDTLTSDRPRLIKIPARRLAST